LQARAASHWKAAAYARLQRYSSRSSRARPWVCSLARTRIVVSRTISLMRAITRPGASDGLGQNFLSVLRRAGLTVGIHFGEIFPQLRRLFLPPLIGKPWGFDGADADGFLLQHTASQQAFNDGLL